MKNLLPTTPEPTAESVILDLARRHRTFNRHALETQLRAAGVWHSLITRGEA